jgi:hypothetical protein
VGSLRAYAENYAEDSGLEDLAEKAGSPYIRVDFNALEGDLDIELYTVDSGRNTIYAFDPSV